MAARRVSKGPRRSRRTPAARKAGARKTAKRVARGKRKTSAKKKSTRTTRAPAVVDSFNGGEPEPDEMLDGLEDMAAGIDDLVDEDSFNDEDDFNS